MDADLSVPFTRKTNNKIIGMGGKDRYGNRTIYFGTHQNGMYKSTDSGRSFVNVGLTDAGLIADVNVRGPCHCAQMIKDHGEL